VLPANYSTYIHAPSRTEPGMAPEGGDSIAVLLPVPNLKSGDTWDADLTERVSRAVVQDLETSFGVEGLADATVVEHRMTPADFRDRLGAVDGNAFAIEPTLHQSAAFRVPNRHPKVRGVYAVGGGSHPGAGVPGVLFGAEVTAGLIAKDHPRAGRIAVPSGRSGGAA
jgi:phytoene desaturase